MNEVIYAKPSDACDFGSCPALGTEDHPVAYTDPETGERVTTTLRTCGHHGKALRSRLDAPEPAALQ